MAQQPICTVAQGIQQWLWDLQTVSTTSMLVYCVNWCESPSRLMTDREHRAVQKLARRCRNKLSSRTGWHEIGFWQALVCEVNIDYRRAACHAQTAHQWPMFPLN